MSLALGACTSTSVVPVPPAPQTARQAVYLAEIAYAAALQVAISYNRLPRCTAATPAVAGAKIGCSDTAVVAALRAADRDVQAALPAAVAAAGTMSASDTRFVAVLGAVSNAVKALQAILSNHGLTEATLG